MNSTARKLENTNERKVIIVLGTVINEGEIKSLHTASCGCGNRVWAASKKESLNYYIEKMKGSCCGTKAEYTGEKLFKGKELLDTPVIEIKKEEVIEATQPIVVTPIEVGNTQETKPVIKEVKIEDLVKRGRKGVTNKQMVDAIIEHFETPANLTIMFDAYPEIFKSSAKYVPDDMKVALEKLIQVKVPNFQLPIGKKTRARLEEVSSN